MTDRSLFSKLFVYRQRPNSSPFENYLTEIFGYALEYDTVFRKDFLNYLQISSPRGDFFLNTQSAYNGYGRPDIEISFPNTIILIEAKVEANERANQLNDYADILLKEKPEFENKHIVYITKYYDHKVLVNNDITLHLLRWNEIYSLINEKHLEITIHLKLFLKENNMDSIQNFTLEDLLAMKTITKTMSKMDELLDSFKPDFESMFGGMSKDSSRSTSLQYNNYINYVQLKYDDITYYLQIGFFWWWDEYEIPYLAVNILVPKNKNTKYQELYSLFKTHLQEWYAEDEGSNATCMKFKAVSDFMLSDDEDNIPAMKKFIKGCLEELFAIRTENPRLLSKIKI